MQYLPFKLKYKTGINFTVLQEWNLVLYAFSLCLLSAITVNVIPCNAFYHTSFYPQLISVNL